MAASLLLLCIVVPGALGGEGAGDRQGHTPYGYGMDVPVKVRSTVSYGRGWQLLRSRGAYTNQTGQCDPTLLANSCDCSSPPPDQLVSDVAADPMPRCVASSLCGMDGAPKAFDGKPVPPKSAIVLVLDANKTSLRFFYGNLVHKAYASQLGLLVKTYQGLKAVGTMLPIFVLTSGLRVPSVEQRLASLGMTVIGAEDAPPVIRPKWGSKWALGSFAKLRVLALTRFETVRPHPPLCAHTRRCAPTPAARQRRAADSSPRSRAEAALDQLAGPHWPQVLLLDNDNYVLRNLDHLALVPAPAFHFAYKCYPRRELRTSLMVVRPSERLWERAKELMAASETAIYDDLGEGSVWRSLFRRAHELPAGFGALRSSNFTAAEWGRVSVVHDPNLLRKSVRGGWKDAKMSERLRAIEDAAEAEMKSFEPLLAAAAPPPRTKKKSKKKSRARAKKSRRLASWMGGAW